VIDERSHIPVYPSGFAQLLSLADEGVIQILNMEFIAKEAAGKSRKV
jgi:hypothetical protein